QHVDEVENKDDDQERYEHADNDAHAEPLSTKGILLTMGGSLAHPLPLVAILELVSAPLYPLCISSSGTVGDSDEQRHLPSAPEVVELSGFPEGTELPTAALASGTEPGRQGRRKSAGCSSSKD